MSLKGMLRSQAKQLFIDHVKIPHDMSNSIVP